jgi:single-stranded DNA-binding protein
MDAMKRNRNSWSLEGHLLEKPRSFEAKGDNGNGPTIYAYLTVPNYWEAYDKERKDFVTNMTPVTAIVKGELAKECLAKLDKGSWVLVTGRLRTPDRIFSSMAQRVLEITHTEVISPLLCNVPAAEEEAGLSAEEAANLDGSSALTAPTVSGEGQVSSGYIPSAGDTEDDLPF